MNIKIDATSQLHTLETLRHAISKRRLPSKIESEYLLANIAALIEQAEESLAREAERERAQQVADFDEIMGGGE